MMNIVYRSQVYEVDQGLHETAYWDSAIRNEFQEILVSIDQRAGAVEYAIEGIFRMGLVPEFNFVEEVLVECPGLPGRQWRRRTGNSQRLLRASGVRCPQFTRWMAQRRGGKSGKSNYYRWTDCSTTSLTWAEPHQHHGSLPRALALFLAFGMK